VAWQHRGVIGKGHDDLLQRATHGLEIATRQIRASDPLVEQHVAAEQERLFALYVEHHRSRGVPRSVPNDQPHPSYVQHLVIAQFAHIIGLGELQRAGRQGLNMGAHVVTDKVQRVGQPFTIRTVDPCWRAVIPAHRDDRPGVVQVPVSDHHRNGLKPVLGHRVGHRSCAVLAGIHDEALLSVSRGHDPAVRGPWASRKSDNEHWRRLPVCLVHSTTVTTSRRERQLAEAKRARQAHRRRQARRHRARIAIAVLTLAVSIATLALVWRPWDRANEQGDTTGSPTAQAETTDQTQTNADGVCQTPAAPRADNLTFSRYEPDAADGVTSIEFGTNCGPITIGLDSRSPETAASMAFLAKSGYFDGIRCHRVTTAGIFVLQCGDPRGDGTGGPGYTIPDENLPPVNANGVAVYPRGIVAMANAGPQTGGSQFFIVYRDSPLPPNYTVWGQISAGIDTIDYVADGGVNGGGPDGVPTRALQFTSATLKP
jgi:peptidyl-prolyl cis-trans isomerase B (cyclophilin B)